MLVRRTRNRRGDAKIDFTPLIDCAFNLLIFFAVSTTLITTRAGIDVKLPGAASADVKPRNVQISIRDDLKVYFEDLHVEDVMLAEMVKKKIAEAPDSSFIINADRIVPYETLIRVVDLVRMSGAERIALAAEREFPETSDTDEAPAR